MDQFYEIVKKFGNLSNYYEKESGNVVIPYEEYVKGKKLQKDILNILCYSSNYRTVVMGRQRYTNDESDKGFVFVTLANIG